jgi:hypothetical protein
MMRDLRNGLALGTAQTANAIPPIEIGDLLRQRHREQRAFYGHVESLFRLCLCN